MMTILRYEWIGVIGSLILFFIFAIGLLVYLYQETAKRNKEDEAA